MPARTRARAIDGALATLAPWLERALARQQPAALGLAQPGVAWHGGEAVPLRIVDCQRARAPAGAPVRSSCARPTPRAPRWRSSAGTAARRALRSTPRSSARRRRSASSRRPSRCATSARAGAPARSAARSRSRGACCSRRPGCWTTSSATSSATCASPITRQAFWRLFATHRPAARLASVAARARRRACRLPAGG